MNCTYKRKKDRRSVFDGMEFRYKDVPLLVPFVRDKREDHVYIKYLEKGKIYVRKMVLSNLNFNWRTRDKILQNSICRICIGRKVRDAFLGRIYET